MSVWIEVADLVKVYSDGTRALDGISFNCGSPLVALVGPNGAGKTTFVRIATGLIRPTKGIVRVMGLDAVSESVKIRNVVALLPQDAVPDPNMRPIDVISYYLALRGYSRRDAVRRAREVLEFVGLDRVAYTRCVNLWRYAEARAGSRCPRG